MRDGVSILPEKKTAPEGQFQFGGAGGNRTRVRRPSIHASTGLFGVFILIQFDPTGRIVPEPA